MKALVKNLINLLRPVNDVDQTLHERQIENSKLRAEKKTDFKRWQNNEQLFSDWDERTIILGSYILPNANIIEFGAGNMILKNHIQNYKSYIPTDIVPRFEETIVCDLNQEIISEVKKCDTAVFSGVLEYVYDINRVFDELGPTIKQVVLSYCCSDIVKLSRDKNGWLSDYTKQELEEIFSKHSFKIENYSEWRQQSIFNLIRL
ncbi:hypothetical protein [Flavobacterium sp. DG2-3]|uniref:hypothetical protein n=1 Tax=Flavobacterium sp. DG2-3 TaxID=3068317 RepID=UPI00273F5D96|nr:hypothetical protein [Flavobacterium sp. DG2-3]MDP5200678.1 hypothetical protein [Flavobacterium sp. DG2-3]